MGCVESSETQSVPLPSEQTLVDHPIDHTASNPFQCPTASSSASSESRIVGRASDQPMDEADHRRMEIPPRPQPLSSPAAVSSYSSSSAARHSLDGTAPRLLLPIVSERRGQQTSNSHRHASHSSSDGGCSPVVETLRRLYLAEVRRKSGEDGAAAEDLFRAWLLQQSSEPGPRHMERLSISSASDRDLPSFSSLGRASSVAGSEFSFPTSTSETRSQRSSLLPQNSGSSSRSRMSQMSLLARSRGSSLAWQQPARFSQFSIPASPQDGEPPGEGGAEPHSPLISDLHRAATVCPSNLRGRQSAAVSPTSEMFHLTVDGVSDS
jgi:hypothetical protein